MRAPTSAENTVAASSTCAFRKRSGGAFGGTLGVGEMPPRRAKTGIVKLSNKTRI